MIKIPTTSKKIDEALKQKGNLLGKGKNKFLIWNDIEDDNSLFDIFVNKNVVRVSKLPESEDYIKYSSAVKYKGEYSLNSDNFKVMFTERVLSGENNGEFNEYKYYLEKRGNLLIKRYNDIYVVKYLGIYGGKSFNYFEYDPITKEKIGYFYCNLDTDNQFVSGEYNYNDDDYRFLAIRSGLSSCDLVNREIYINHSNVDNRLFTLSKLSLHVDYLKYKLDTSDELINNYIIDFINSISKSVKDNPDKSYIDYNDLNFDINLLLDFDQKLSDKIMILSQNIPLCELNQRINNSLGINKKSEKEIGPVLKKK